MSETPSKPWPDVPPDPVEQVPSTPFDAPSGSWTFVALPDTQHYSADFPEVFHRITEWIVAHRESHAIQFVAHLGDIVDDNLHPQWQNARAAMQKLTAAKVPYVLSLGNHDMPSVQYKKLWFESERPCPRWREPGRGSLLNEYFSDRECGPKELGGVFEVGQLENCWQMFTTPTGPYLVLALEYGPRREVLDWANGVLARFPEAVVVALIHEYLVPEGVRYDWAKYGETQTLNCKQGGYGQALEVLDAEEIWQGLLSRHPNVHFVLCGHRRGAAYLADRGAGGQTVHQILADYTPQWGYGGGGYIRLMRVGPEGRTMQVRTYSPWYDTWMDDPANAFDLVIGQA